MQMQIFIKIFLYINTPTNLRTTLVLLKAKKTLSEPFIKIYNELHWTQTSQIKTLVDMKKFQWKK